MILPEMYIRRHISINVYNVKPLATLVYFCRTEAKYSQKLKKKDYLKVNLDHHQLKLTVQFELEYFLRTLIKLKLVCRCFLNVIN